MDKTYFIFQYLKQGNIGICWHLQKVEGQPHSGFKEIKDAELFIKTLKIEGWWNFGFTILPIYQPSKP